MRRRFAQIGTRHVHYRRSGTGPPIVLIHGSPASSEILGSEMQALSATNTCFGFDTPGFGDSAPLDSREVSIELLADALAETLRALQFPACPVFGSHTGAAIAIELARRHPALVTGLILDGVPMYSYDEQQQLFTGYFAPLVVDDLGGHFANTWTRFRDMFIWFPWTQKHPQSLNDSDAPSAQRLQLWVSMFFRAATHYMPAYRAAIGYGSQALEAVRALTLPAVFMAQDTDMLYSHLQRLPPLRPRQSIERVTRANKLAVITNAAARLRTLAAAPDDPVLTSTPQSIVRHFFDFDHGQVLVRLVGEAAVGWTSASQTLLLLHDAPGSSLSFEALMPALAKDRRVLTLDLPGCGESVPFTREAPTISDYAALVMQVLDHIGVGSCVLYGSGFGSTLALTLAALRPAKFPRLLLHGICLPTAAQQLDMQQHYSPHIEIQADGSHWYRTWLMLRDSLVYFPWYSGTASALRRVPADFDAQTLHERTFEVLKQAGGYAQFVQAVLAIEPGEACAALSGSKVSVTVLEDASHPFAAFSVNARAMATALKWQHVEHPAGTTLDTLRHCLSM